MLCNLLEVCSPRPAVSNPEILHSYLLCVAVAQLWTQHSQQNKLESGGGRKVSDKM
jgi:hypothetical protein